MNSVKPLYHIINKINEFIALVGTDENNTLQKTRRTVEQS